MPDSQPPRVFSIPAGTPFLPTFVDALLAGTLTGGWPDGAELADAIIFLPTRRAGRALARTIAETVGRPTLLPRIVPLGDVDAPEFEAGPASGLPSIPALERRLILARLVRAWVDRFPREAAEGGGGAPLPLPATPADCVALAGDLEALMDSLATEDVPWSRLENAVVGDLSHHFELTLRFVRIAQEAWPALLAERGAADPARRRHDALLAEAARIADGHDGPVVAAGSTGSVPAAAALIGAIARARHGGVVLPGLDLHLPEADWRAISSPEPLWGHPQFNLQRLLSQHLRCERADVEALGPRLHPHAPPEARRRMMSEVMRPAETTDAWAEIPPMERRLIAVAGVERIALVEAEDEREEALAIAIALRETLDEPGRTAALVTPSRDLARRVAIELGRWGIAAIDSAGTPLAETAAGRLARLVAECAASAFDPVALLALLAHPAVTFGGDRAEIVRGARTLEIGVLRGPAPAPGIDGLKATLARQFADRSDRDPIPRQALSVRDWEVAADTLTRLEGAFGPLATADTGAGGDLASLAALHRDVVQALAGTPDGLAGWDELQALFDDLEAAEGSEDGLAGPLSEYPAFFAVLARDRPVAPDGRSAHPRVSILGLLEARLLEVDRVVLGGLDETIWPPRAETDSFLSRPMRIELGLSPPERRIGQTAHDFVQAMGAGDVVLTRARKRDGKPTVPSRFLARLEAFADADIWAGVAAAGRRYRDLTALIDAPRAALPVGRPAPKPGPERFPRRLSVTEIETLIRDPYAIYARHILRLSPLDPIAAAPSAAERGSALHAVLGDFAKAWPGDLPPDPATELIRLGTVAFAEIQSAYPDLHALWWPEFRRLVPSMVDWERERRSAGIRIAAERSGQLTVALGEGDELVVRARADRIEAGPGGGAIVDFKSGRPPSNREVAAGLSPQLTLEAEMLRRGGFRDLPAASQTPELVYVKLGGRARLKATAIKPPDGGSVAEIVARHVAGLAEAARRYAVDGEGYASKPLPHSVKTWGDYDHLARVAEWSEAQ